MKKYPTRVTQFGMVVAVAVWMAGQPEMQALDNATFTFAVDSNAWYNFQASTDLSKWSLLQTRFFPSNGVFNLTDVESSNYPYRFYRRVGAPVPPPGFGKSVGGNSSDSAQSVVIDDQGNLYLVGRFAGSIDLGGGTFSASGPADIFMAKYDSNGVYQLSYRYGSTGNEGAHGLALGPNGELVMAGGFSGITDLRESSSNPNSCRQGAVPYGTSLSASGEDIFLARYDPSCVCFWARKFGGQGNDVANSVAVDSQGYIYMTGSFDQAADFGGGGNFLVSGGVQNAFFAKYDFLGNYQWTLAYGDATISGNSVRVDKNGDAILSCNFTVSVFTNISVTSDTGQGSIPLPSGLTNCRGSSSFFVAKYAPGTNNAPGNVFWMRFATFSAGVTNNGFVQANSVAADSEGNVYVSGTFGTNIVFGGNNAAFFDAPGTTNTLIGTTNAAFGEIGPAANNGFIAKYSSTGNCLWVKALNDTGGGAQILASCVDTNDFLTVAGAFRDTLNVDGTLLINTNTTQGINNLFISKFSSTGLNQWTHSYSSTQGIQPTGISANLAAGLLVTGSYRGTGELGSLTTNSANNSADGFLFQIDP